MRREECDRMVEVVEELGAPAIAQLRDMLRTGQARQAVFCGWIVEPSGCADAA